MGKSQFSQCASLPSVPFESPLKLSRFGKQAFEGTGLLEIVIFT
jgi:hypothetical protein